MFARKLITGVVAGGVAASVIGLTAGTASAAYSADPGGDDLRPTGFNAVDVVGAGSDTTQGVMRDLAEAYNKTNPTARLATYSALGGGTIPLTSTVDATNDPARPTSSGTGRNLLQSDPNLDFARSSGAISATEADQGQRMFPFARDGLQMAVAGGSSYAPASLTAKQIVDIYSCTITNWKDVGGKDQVITPLAPGSTSGTYSFWVGQLKAANGGQDFKPSDACTKPTQEHDPNSVNNVGQSPGTPGAIAPFSVAKAFKLPTANKVTLLGGFAPTRPVYNVLRSTQTSQAALQAIFGTNGYLCSAAGKTVIEAAGFRQLLPVSQGGVCGTQLTTAPSNTLVDQVSTTTSVTVTSASASAARIVARVVPADASTTPVGTVSFFEGTTTVANNVPLASGGQATTTVPAAPGTHTYRAVYTPSANSAFTGSSGSGTGVVSAAAKSGSTISESFPAKAKVKVKTVKGKKKTTVKAVSGAVTVVGGASRPAGTVLVKKGSKTVGSGSLINGVATFSISGLKPGTNKLTVTYGGDAATNGGALSFTVKAGAKKKKGGK